MIPRPAPFVKVIDLKKKKIKLKSGMQMQNTESLLSVNNIDICKTLHPVPESFIDNWGSLVKIEYAKYHTWK